MSQFDLRWNMLVFLRNLRRYVVSTSGICNFHDEFVVVVFIYGWIRLNNPNSHSCWVLWYPFPDGRFPKLMTC